MIGEPEAQFEMRLRPCPTCGTEASRELGLRGGEHHRYRLGVATRIVQCERCSLVFPNPFPYAKQAAQLYGDPEKYFAHLDGQVNENHRTIVREGLKRLQGSRSRFLDVGCGLGELLNAATLEGLSEVVGLEISQATTDNARKRCAAEVHCLTVEEYARNTEKQFDLVTLSAVLEHVYDPDSTIAAIAKLCRPGAMLYIDLPCEPNLLTHVGNAVNRMMRKRSVFNLSPTWPPFHVFGFNERALRMLLEKHGFQLEILDVWAAPEIRSNGGFGDKLRAWVGTQVNRVANMLKMSANMSGWARRL